MKNSLVTACGCRHCGRPAGEYLLCHSCTSLYADNLSAAPDLHSELDVTFARWDALTVPTGRGGDPGLPCKLPASAAAATLVSAVLNGALLASTGRTSPWSLPTTLDGLTRWLRARLDWLRLLDGAAAQHQQLDDAVRDARRIIDYPTHRCEFPVGPCGMLIGGVYCPGTVWALVPTSTTEPAVLRCSHAGCAGYSEPWTSEQWRTVSGKMRKRQGTMVS